MFVKNFNILMVANSFAPNNSEGTSTFSVTKLDGTKLEPSFRVYNAQPHGYNTKLLYIDNILFGDSDYNVTYNQHNIQGTEITLDNMNIIYYYGLQEDGTVELFYRVTGTPTVTSIVREIGLTKKVYTDNNVEGIIMIYRQVLDIPIEFVANETVDLMFKITYPLI